MESLLTQAINEATIVMPDNPRPGLVKPELRPLYEQDDVKSVISSIMKASLEHAKNGDGHRVVTYLAGANGSKDLLIEAAANGEAPRVREALERSAFFDFGRAKEMLGNALNINVDDNYDERWRPLLAAMDRTISRYAREHDFNLVIDNTMASSVKGEESPVMKRIRQEREVDGTQIHVFAVALTPKQAKQVAKEKGLGASPKEVEDNAQNFAAGFDFLTRQVDTFYLYQQKPNVIDPDIPSLHKIYMQAPQEEKPYWRGEVGEELVDSWKQSCQTPEETLLKKSGLSNFFSR